MHSLLGMNAEDVKRVKNLKQVMTGENTLNYNQLTRNFSVKQLNTKYTNSGIVLIKISREN